MTNTQINRIAGLEALPPVPDDLQPVFGKGAGDATDVANGLIGFEPLPRSGLLGPVRIVPLKEVRLLRESR